MRDEIFRINTEVTCPSIAGKFCDMNVHELANSIFRFRYLLRHFKRQKTGDVRDPGIEDVSVVLDAFNGG
jgi:hypothetical protein